MIPVLLFLGAVLGRWWRATLIIAAVGWPALLVATDVMHLEPDCADREGADRPITCGHIRAGHAPESAVAGDATEVSRNVVPDRSDTWHDTWVRSRQHR
jgi:hypothetical protein